MLTCRHCKEPRTFDGRHDRHGHVIFGQAPQEQIARATREAINHLQIRHPEKFEQMNVIVASVTGLSLMINMRSDVPDAKQKEQRAAAEIVKAFGRVVTDEDIEKQIRKWQSDNGYQNTMTVEGAIELLQQLRDALSYADISTVPSPINAPPPNGENVRL